LPQVVAAGYAFSPDAGDKATIVKLARICLLAPIVFFVGFFYARQKSKNQQAVHRGKINYWSMFPKFVLGFLALAFLRTKGWLPEVTVHFPDQIATASAAATGAPDNKYSLADIAQKLSGYCIVMSMAGVGIETKFKAMKQTGLRPLVAATISALVIALVILGLIKFLKIT
jgi:uncharacterized membrane protein YadS